MSLLTAMLSLAACSDPVRIDFQAEQALFDVERDSGVVTLGDGATTRVRTHAYAGYTVRASALVEERDVEPIEDSGHISVQGSFGIDIEATLDLPVGSFDGPVDSRLYEFDVEIGSFDPFLIEQEVTVVGGAMVADELRFPIAGVPGVDLVLEYESFTLIPTYEGICIEQEGSVVQYTGRIAIDPDIRYLAYVEIAIPFSDPEVIGPAGIDLELPTLVSQDLDLGTFSMSTGARVEGVFPCGEVEPPP